MSNIATKAKIDSVNATGYTNEIPLDQVDTEVTTIENEKDEKLKSENSNGETKQADTTENTEAEENPIESPFKKAAESGTGFAGFASVEKSTFMDAITRLNSAESSNIFSQPTQNDTKSQPFSNGSWLPSSNSIFAQGSQFGSFSSRLSSTSSLFPSQSAEDAESDPESERPTTFLIGSQNPNYVPIQENIFTGEESEISMFSHDGILYQIVEGKWVSRGKSKVKLNRSRDASSTCPARLIVRMPGTNALMLNQPLSSNITSTGPRSDQPQCLDFTTMSNDKAELYALKFKEESSTNEFFITFNKLKEHYQKSKYATANSSASDPNGKTEETHTTSDSPKRTINETEDAEENFSQSKKARDTSADFPASDSNEDAE